ncbi:MAG: hypothetical protein FWC86_04255 [Coriobacteriia bacterium]|nr:hypothetical protein [Coriobacteriia bacterium]
MQKSNEGSTAVSQLIESPEVQPTATAVPPMSEGDVATGKGKKLAALILAGVLIFFTGFVSSIFVTPLLMTFYYMNLIDQSEWNGTIYDVDGNLVQETWDEHWDSLTNITMPDGSGIGIPGTEVSVTDEMRAEHDEIAERSKILMLPGFTDMEPFDVRAFYNGDGRGKTEIVYLYGDETKAFDISIRSDGNIGIGASNIDLNWAQMIETVEDLERAWNER